MVFRLTRCSTRCKPRRAPNEMARMKKSSSPHCCTTSANSSRCPITPGLPRRFCDPTYVTRCTAWSPFHQDFQGRYYYEHLGMSPNLREQHRDQPWYELAEKFADHWDQKAFDPAYDSESFEHFEPMVINVFAQAKSI